MLSLSSHVDAGTVTVTVSGEIDLANVDELADEIVSAVRGEATTVVVDLAGVTFIDSVGITALLKGRRLADEHGKAYRATGAEGLVRQLLDLTGVWTHLSGQTS
ncbi:MAG TPA: STAS domain-containing protein [Micromonosporaceae bacterium]|nr:STAS domain-containing protein [Micromonosporaceae bacterium]